MFLLASRMLLCYTYLITMGGDALEQSQNPLFEHAGTATTGTAIPGTSTLEQLRAGTGTKKCTGTATQNFRTATVYDCSSAFFVVVPARLFHCICSSVFVPS